MAKERFLNFYARPKMGKKIKHVGYDGKNFWEKFADTIIEKGFQS